MSSAAVLPAPVGRSSTPGQQPGSPKVIGFGIFAGGETVEQPLLPWEWLEAPDRPEKRCEVGAFEPGSVHRSAPFRIERAAQPEADEAAGAEDHRSAHRLLELEYRMRQLPVGETAREAPAHPGRRATRGISRWCSANRRMLSGGDRELFATIVMPDTSLRRQTDIAAALGDQPAHLPVPRRIAGRFQMAIEHDRVQVAQVFAVVT